MEHLPASHAIPSVVITVDQNPPGNPLTLRLRSVDKVLLSIFERLCENSLSDEEETQLREWSTRLLQLDFNAKDEEARFETTWQLCLFLVDVLRPKINKTISEEELEKLDACDEEIRGILSLVNPSMEIDSLIADCEKAIFRKEAYVNRLGDMLYKYDDWGDPLSVRLLNWVDITHLIMSNPEFELNEVSKEYIVKRIDQLFNKTLLNSFDRDPVKNQRVVLLTNPVLERRWTWEKNEYLDWMAIYRCLFPGSNPRSPFDGEEMQSIHTIHSHEFANELREWAIGFLKGIGHAVSEDSAPSPKPENEDLSLVVFGYTREQADRKYHNYVALAQDASNREYGRGLKKQMKLARKEFAQMEAKSNEYVAREKGKVEQMLQTYQGEMQEDLAKLEEQHRQLEGELASLLEEERREVERVREENRVQNEQADARANELHQIRQAELRRELETREENHVRQVEAMRNQIADGEREAEAIRAEGRENQARAEAQANMRHEAHQAEIQNQIQNMEQNSQIAEEAWRIRSEENERRIEAISAQNLGLAQSIAQTEERHTQTQANLLRQMGAMQQSHNQTINGLQSQLNNMQATINHLNHQLHSKTATCNALQNQVNVMVSNRQNLEHQIHHAKKKANKKWYKF